MFYVYVIYNKEASKYYIGQTEDIDIRLRQHNNHTFKSYTSRFPGEWELIYKESVATRSEALRREKGLKSGRGREFIKTILGNNTIFRRSSMVEQEAVNFEVTGSSPVAGAKLSSEKGRPGSMTRSLN